MERLRAVSLLSTALTSTVSSMRRNAKYAAAGGEESLLSGFRALRRTLHGWRDDSQVAALEYLSPFLAVVRSDETSGPITASALSAVLAILTAGLVRAEEPGASEAMHALVDAVTHCRFEATEPGHDEAVLASICDVLLAALCCDSGALLSDEAVCAIVQAAYHIGHQSGRESPLLSGVSRRTLREIATRLFRSLPPTHRATAEVGEPEAGAAAPPAPHGLPCCVEVLAFAVSLASFPEDADVERERGAPNGAALEHGARDELRVTGVTLAAAALEAGAGACCAHPRLLNLLRDDLSRALVAAACSPSAPPALLACACGLMVTLTLRLRGELKHQLGAFLQFALLPLAEGPPGEAQRCAVEALAQLACSLPTLACELYANFDCDLRAPPLFERTAALLAKAAFPGASPTGGAPQLSATNVCAVEALNGILDAMAERSARLASPAVADADADAQADAPVEAAQCSYDAGVWREPGRYLGAASRAAAAGDVVGAAAALRAARALRARVAAGAEHFNRDEGKGLQLLRASGLLPSEPLAQPEAHAFACAAFLRHASGLDKAAVGEYLGAPGPEVAAVLRAFSQLFDFARLPLDAALRLFLDGFLLPGEAQKISRCLEAFAARFHACNPGGVAADADSAYVLSYSIIMLNTDLHNPQVRVKMTKEQFVRNNRGTNDGANWPRDYLTAIYEAIEQDAIRMSAEGAAGGATAASWLTAQRCAAQGEGRLLVVDAPLAQLLDGELFARLWGPACGALACVFEHAAGAGAAGREAQADAAAGFAALARVAASHGQLEVVDHVLSQLCRFTQQHPLAGSPSAGAAAAGFGADARARLAAAAACGVAARHGDALRAGWRPLLDMLLRLQSMGVLQLPRSDGEEGDAAEGDPAPPLAPPPVPRAAPASGLLRGFSSLLSLDVEPQSPPQLSAAELEAAARARRCGEQCRVGDLVADSKFLEQASLGALARAVAEAGAAACAADDAPAACACLDLLAALALRNRDRIAALWPLLVSHLRGVVTDGGAPQGVAERALLTLLRICQRLLPYKHELAEELLAALRLVLSLDARAADALMPRLAHELRTLLRVSAAHLAAEDGWDTLGRLLTVSARHPDASSAAFEALCSVLSDPAFGACICEQPGGPLRVPASFAPCCAAAVAFASSRAGGEERSRGAVQLLCSAGLSLAQRAPPAPLAQCAQLHGAWGDLVAQLRRLSSDERCEVREEALSALLRVLLAAQPLGLPAGQLAAVYEAQLLPLFGELVDTARRRGREAHAAERALCAALPLLCKPLLTFLPLLRSGLPPGEWHALWAAVLDRLCAAARVAATDELAEAVPEALKNCILVFATSGALEASDSAFWELTWRRAAAVDPQLTPQLLQPSQRTQRAASAEAVPPPAEAAEAAAAAEETAAQGQGAGPQEAVAAAA